MLKYEINKLICEELNEATQETIGGKAKHLFKLQSWGLKVPRLMVLSTEAHKLYQESNELPDDLVSSLKSKLSQWSSPSLAVRSSMTAEDGKETSYAGMMESYLHVKPEEVVAYAKKCFDSMNSDRVKVYENLNESIGDDHKQQAAVIVQEMIDSDVSGVAFSRSPIGDSALISIEGSYGIGEGIVAGLVDVDRFFMNRFGDLVSSDIAKKEKAVRHAPLKDGENIELRDVAKDDQEKPCLSKENLKELFEQIIKIEANLTCPADIEWAIKNDQVFILQVRPITQEFADIDYYIDTNLCESYPGVISPLGADFVKLAYTTVITEMFECLGYSEAALQELEPSLKNLVRDVDGHMYYNLRSYYNALAHFPGGKKNIDNWHRMIGGKTAHFIDASEFETISRRQSIRAAAEIANYYLRHKKKFGKVLSGLQESSEEMEASLSKGMSVKECLEFVDYWRKNLKGFGDAAVNDLLIMSAVKGVVSILERNGYDETSLPELIKTDDGVDSLEPLFDLNRLVVKLKLVPDFMEQMESLINKGLSFNEKDPYQELFESIDGFDEVKTEIRAYLEKHGDRSFEELKLECLTLKQSPENLLDLLKFKIASADQTSGHGSENKKTVDTDSFSVKDKLLLKVVVPLAHQTIAMREETRLVRGQFYSRIRRAYIKAFASLIEDHPLDFRDFKIQDFFALRISDLESYVQGNLNAGDLANIMKNYKTSEKMKDYPEFFACASDNQSPKISLPKVEALEGGALQGLGVSPGLVTGEALVLHDPRDAFTIKDLSNRILVTKNTDPAWVYIMSQCKALISEKGSLLSHTAIIGRELGIPTVVAVKGAVASIQDGQAIGLDGTLGVVKPCQ